MTDKKENIHGSDEKTCLICKKPFIPYVLGTKNDFSFESCRACGSVICTPMPTKKELEDFYREVEPQVTHLPNHNGEVLRIKKALMKLGNDLAGKRFLDVAARQGYGVKAAHLLSMKPFGIDEHDFFINFAQSKYPADMFKNISVVDYAETAPEKYDFVLAEQSFSEQPELEPYVAALSSLVKPGGLIYLEEVDGNHWNIPRSVENWDYADPPINFVFPSKSGMEDLLARHNLHIQKIFFTWKPVMRMIVQRLP
jgi:SAM-dependent methyltransferase